MARRVVGLDLGAYSVKLVRLECGKQSPKFEVIDHVEEILPLGEGEEHDLKTRQKEAVLRLHEKGLLDAETSAVAIGAQEGQMRIMKTPFLETRKIEAVLPGLLEAELPFEMNTMTIAWHRVEEPKLEKGAEKPTEANIRIAFGKKPAIASCLQMLQASSVDPRFLHLSSTAMYELVRELGWQTFSRQEEAEMVSAAAIIDFGHQSTNLCIFDRHGIKFSRSFMRGGQKLTEAIAQALSVTVDEATQLKHEKLDLLAPPTDEQTDTINRLAREHYHKILEEITRTLIAFKTSENVAVKQVTLLGGASTAKGLHQVSADVLNTLDVFVSPAGSLHKHGILDAFALPFALALSCIQIHAKDSRFNFRKDEFSWRGDLDFLRTKSTPLILWTLVIICSTTILWSANSLVLQKESSSLEQRLKSVCTQILGQPNVTPKKCLAMMQEQIDTGNEVSIPEYTASDIYIKSAEMLPKELNVSISELEVLEKKVRITAEVASFEDVDKVAASLGKIPCLINIEKGSAQKKDSVVKVSMSGDVDCNPVAPKSKAESRKPEAKSKAKP